MRNLHKLAHYLIDPGSGHKEGKFMVPGPTEILIVIACDGDGWDHLSVSCRERTPTWEEMEFIKRMFFKDDETAMQLHVPPAEHINNNPHVLHIWRPHRLRIPRPPSRMV